jgi:hypothetical protein
MVVLFASGGDAGKIAGIRVGRKAEAGSFMRRHFFPLAAAGLGQQRKTIVDQ